MNRKKRKAGWFPAAALTAILWISIGIFPQSEDDLTGVHSFAFDHFFMQTLPGGYFFPSFFENYAPDTTFLIEESNGFALVDNPRVYFEGDSFVNFNWQYHGMNINSVLNEGAPAVRLPFSAVNGYRLRGETPLSRNYGMNFLPTIPHEDLSQVTASAIYSDLGSYSPWAAFMINVPAYERADRLYRPRRKSLDNFFVDYIFHKKFADAGLTFAVNCFDTTRQFNDFNLRDQTFEEEGKLFLFNTRFRKNLHKGFYEIFGVFNHSRRDNLHAETGSYPQETLDQKRQAFLGGILLAKPAFTLKLYFLYEKEKRLPFVYDFSKELLDNDGDGFFPFRKVGEFAGSTLNLDLDVPLELDLFNREVKINAYADFRYTRLEGWEETNRYNTLLFEGDPYQVLLWEKGDAYDNTHIDLKAGLTLSFDVSRDLSLVSHLFWTYNRLGFDYSPNNLNFSNPGFDIGLLWSKSKKTKILFSYGIIPYQTRENVNFFLESRGASGAIYDWNDINGDSDYQAGEEGQVYGYTGARFHFVDPDISAPLKKRLLLNLSTRLSRNWTFNLKGIYKKIENNFWVTFNREFGSYREIDGVNLYFFDRPFRDYYLSNYPFEEDPFYAQLLLHLKGGKKDKWFLSVSFLAHIGMGATSFGNGADSSDIGLIRENQAHPNTHLNGYGRVDGDRAFVFRCYGGFHIARDLFLGFGLKYRDGNPFSFMNAVERNGQWVIYYQTIKAEDKRGKKGGPREDYLSDISVKLSYYFKLFDQDWTLSLSAFNLLDVGYELSEYVFSGGTRDAVELTIPRSIRLTLSVKF